MLAADRVAGEELRTERLVLAPLAPAHAPALYPLIDDWDVARMLAQVEWPVTLESVKAFAAKKTGPDSDEDAFAILLDGAPIGVAGVKRPGTSEPPRKMPRLGYWIGRQYWGRGYATEAVAALVGYAFARHARADKVGAGVFVDNPASRRLLEKLGFERRGGYPFFCMSRGESVQLDDMHLTRARWAALAGRA